MLLTIGIPVYNGENNINRTIDSIIQNYSNENSLKVKILFSDNNSTDSTLAIINEKLNELKFETSVNTNNDNIGYDGNIDRLISLCDTEYIWFLGCGEILKNESLVNIIKKIESTRLNQYIINFDSVDECTDNYDSYNNFQIFNDKYYTSDNADEFISKYNGAELCLSANIVKVSLLKKALTNKLVSNGWAHLERIWQGCLGEEISAGIISRICITLYKENGGWYHTPIVIDFIIGLMKLYNKYLSQQFPRLTKNKISDSLGPFLKHGIILSKKKNVSITFFQIKKMISLYYKYIKFWFIFMPLILVPKKIFIIREQLRK